MTKSASNPSIQNASSGIKFGPNPFPATAVATLSQSAEFLSIETQALKQAQSYLNDYLQRASRDQQKGATTDEQGLIIAIVGDYGTGKTHIAQEMLQQIYAQHNSFLHPIYLDAPSDNFLALYRDRFMKKLDRREVLQRVDDYYADIVADELEKSDLTKPVAIALRERKVSADEIVNKFGLMESTFIRTLSERLKNVTKQLDFGTALLLMRRTEFQPAVWEWLNGAMPDTLLQERNIKRQINNDAIALESIGVMAFLFGQQKHRFILFIDEMEKVLSHVAPQRPDEATVLALKKLMEAMSTTRAMLVLIGLPEFQEFLPDDARQRIAVTIHPSRVTKDEIIQYIHEAQRRVTSSDSLDPFTMDSIDYLAEITGGNARKMVRLCYHAYLAATEAKSHVNRPMLREIAREQFEATSVEDITAEITRHIESHGWLFEREKAIGTGKDAPRADYWLPVREGGIGIALLLCRSLLQQDEVQRVTQTATRISGKNNTKIETLLVINGYLADNLRPELEKVVGRVLIYRVRSFREDLDSILIGVRTRLEQRDKENILAAIMQRVDEIARQNRNIDEQLARNNLTQGELQSAVSIGLRNVFGQLAAESSISETNYPRVASVFDEFDRTLNILANDNMLFDWMFGCPQPLLLDKEGTYFLSRRTKLANQDLKSLAHYHSELQLVREACKAFRRGVFVCLKDWRGSQSIRSLEMMELITSMCRNFDNFAEGVNWESLIEERMLTEKLVDEIGVNFGSRYREMLLAATAPSKGKEVIDDVRRELRDLAKRVYEAIRNYQR